MSETVSTLRKMTLSDRVAAEVRAEMARQQISGRALALKMGRSANWVSLKTSGSSEIGLADLEKIAAALGTKPVELLRRAETVTAEYTSTPMVTPDLPVQRVASTPVPELAGRFASASLPRPAGRMRTAPTGY